MVGVGSFFLAVIIRIGGEIYLRFLSRCIDEEEQHFFDNGWDFYVLELACYTTACPCCHNHNKGRFEFIFPCCHKYNRWWDLFVFSLTMQWWRGATVLRQQMRLTFWSLLVLQAASPKAYKRTTKIQAATIVFIR